jgi:hypothetical protein
MRRGFSILLMLLFGLAPLAPALDGSDDAGLPACCRRNGAHHCAMNARAAAMMAKMEAGSGPALSAPLTCPDFPGTASAIVTSPPALVAASIALPLPAARARVVLAVDAAHGSDHAGTHAGRGPPIEKLA